MPTDMQIQTHVYFNIYMHADPYAKTHKQTDYKA